jgi:hypothetical protein
MTYKLVEQQAILQVSYVLIKVLLGFENIERGISGPDLRSKPSIVSKLSISHKAGVSIRLTINLRRSEAKQLG